MQIKIIDIDETWPFPGSVVATADEIKARVRKHPQEAQAFLEAEYRRSTWSRPRYGLCIWLKRHRPYNPTTRVIHNR